MKLIISNKSKSNRISNIHSEPNTTLFLSDEEIQMSKALIEKELFFIKTQQSKSIEEKDVESVSFWNLMESMFKATYKKLKPKTQLNFGELDSYYGVIEMNVVDMTKTIFTKESVRTIQSLKSKIQAIHHECIVE
ncbi:MULTISPECIES: hypothetical protein [Bacillus cereus group]|uniref:Uncharacterized protein n=1 Tax=Bacillus thuringiensis TaxID=1428 RepID=A0A9X6VCN7_BACTU|nr:MULTISPECIES: hypothetical protein [Bacillus cereus group]MEC3270672.1 hypothetical protein [Bacillus thuringiensis]PFB08103.1 hypothetical protein CN398_10325 [Bacillus thuringiensis]HDR7922591.1 hypothetical protein [Bacillus paranthracis]